MIPSGSHHHAPPPSSSPNLIKYIGLGAIALPLAWYTYVTTYTRWHLRKRNKLWKAFLASSQGQETLFESVAEAIRARYGSLRDVFTGRYMNVTFEYREQGVHEFLFHQLIWRPLSGQLFWNGGTADRAELDANLPIEPMDWPRLRKASRKGKERAFEQDPTVAAQSVPSQSGNTSEEEWEKLDDSRIQAPVANTPDDADKITVTWFGQSTCLVQMQGVTFLTDPVFGDKTIDSIFASPRLRDTPCSLSELLQQDIVDVVLLSHDHFDHLDENVVKALRNKALWIIPLGLANWFIKRGVTNIQEMDWWQSESLPSLISIAGNDLEIHCTPVQHWSGRTPWGANQSLWCGFVVKSLSTGKSFYHCGDTGYSQDLFQAIGRMHAPITLAFLPIGSYDPRWIMSTVHTDPEGSVRIHRDLGVQKSIAVHHSTWIMSDERYDDPPKELKKQMKRLSLEEDDFIVIPVGRTLEV